MRVLDQGRVEQALAYELLGDRRGAAAVATERAQRRRDDGDGVEAGVVPEGLVLDRGGRVEQHLGDLVEGHGLALGIPEAGQLDLAGPVVDDRLLGKDVVLQLARIGQVGRERAIDADRGDGRDGAKAGEEREQDDGEPADGRRARAARASRAGGGSGGGHQEGRTPESGLAVPGG